MPSFCPKSLICCLTSSVKSPITKAISSILASIDSIKIFTIRSTIGLPAIGINGLGVVSV